MASHLTHHLENQRKPETSREAVEPHGLPDINLEAHQMQKADSTMEGPAPPTSTAKLSIPNVFPNFLKSFDDRMPWREDPSPATLTESWSEANSAIEYLIALSEIAREVTAWRETYEGMRLSDEMHLQHLEVNLGAGLDPETPLFGSPKDDAQLRESMSDAREKVKEVFGKIQDEKKMQETIATLSQILIMVQKMAGAVGLAAAVEAFLMASKNPETIEGIEVELRSIQDKLEQMGAYIEWRWKDVIGTPESKAGGPSDADEAMPDTDRSVESPEPGEEAKEKRAAQQSSSISTWSPWSGSGWAGCEVMGYDEYPN